MELHQEKTRRIEFGRFAAANRKRRGKGKPETFDFLGFTHICAKTRKTSRFTVRRKTIAKRLRAKAEKRSCDEGMSQFPTKGDGYALF
jgi:pantothenate kinase